MTLSVDSDRTADHNPSAGFALRTVRCDPTRAEILASGHLTSDSADVLAQVLDGHIRAGRRYLRLHVGRVRSVGETALDVIAAVHDRLLAERGTLVLTGVGDQIEKLLRTASPASPLLILRPTAAELRR
jgi:anti-anti-sigma regulatory factor